MKYALTCINPIGEEVVVDLFNSYEDALHEMERIEDPMCDYQIYECVVTNKVCSL